MKTCSGYGLQESAGKEELEKCSRSKYNSQKIIQEFLIVRVVLYCWARNILLPSAGGHGTFTTGIDII
ncbi:MAG: hypothetical protein D3910_23825 [Candidatus Electrothrix sp. ATG2]|nr:hypothetical protein [Candidatus Electrothrix sp. ATG2]